MAPARGQRCLNQGFMTMWSLPACLAIIWVVSSNLGVAVATTMKPPMEAPVVTVTPPFEVPAPPNPPEQVPIDPDMLQKWVQPFYDIPAILGFEPNCSKVKELTIGMWEVFQNVHPFFKGNTTRVYAYGLSKETAAWPGPTIVVRRNQPLRVNWENHLPAEHFLPIDYTLVEPNYPPPGSNKGVGTTVHVHGGENAPSYDGHPHTWFTNQKYCDRAIDFPVCLGTDFRTNKFLYYNDQPPTTLLYHDHTLGITRLNVYAGLAGGYVITEPKFEDRLMLPSGEFDKAVVLQDRLFTETGELIFPARRVSRFHPKWIPELIGNIPVVNGKVWPVLEVKRCQYRFRVIQGSNARFYNLFSTQNSSMRVPIYVIATDGGYLERPVKVMQFEIGPGMRRTIVIDFSKVPDNINELILMNDAPAPSPGGNTTFAREILKFKILPFQHGIPGCRTGPLPAFLNRLPSFVPRNGVALKRLHTLTEQFDAILGGTIHLFLNNLSWFARATEIPTYTTSEEWWLINLTGDDHPIHLHLVQTRIKSRQTANTEGYINGTCQIGGTVGTELRPVRTYLPLPSCLIGAPVPPRPEEDGLVDTFIVPPGGITYINMRFSSLKLVPYNVDKIVPFPFNPTAFPGYVWHCHILDHEDNEMMRPMIVRANTFDGQNKIYTPFSNLAQY